METTLREWSKSRRAEMDEREKVSTMNLAREIMRAAQREFTDVMIENGVLTYIKAVRAVVE